MSADLHPVEDDAAVSIRLPSTSLLSVYDGVEPAQRAALDAATTSLEIAAGDWLFHQGDVADAMYVVRRGRLDVVVGNRVVRSIGPGEVIGELALLTGERRSAGIRAARDSVLGCVTEDTFRRVVAHDPALLLQVTRTIARRLQSMSPPPLASAPPTVIAVLGLAVDAPASRIAQSLSDALSMFVSSTLVGEIAGESASARLEAAEARSDRVVLDASGGRPEWRDFCLRSADRVVVVVGGGELAASAADAARLRGCHLVFADRSPSRAELAVAHDSLAAASVHCLAGAEMVSGIRPLAARLAGRSLGIALAGGGARALAHLGVLEVFTEAGIGFDRVAGTSMGAIVGAAWASGRDSADIYACLYDEFVRRNPLGDYTLPKHGLIKGRRTQAAFERQFGDVHIEELPHEFSCVSVDLLAKQPFVHRRGRLVDALLASVRLPGIFAPLRAHGSLHVDGTVLDNLPVGALTGRGDGPVVAVDIGSGGSGGSRAAGDRPPRMPTLSETLLRTTLAGGAVAARDARARADLVIAPDVGGIGMFCWREIDAAREAGRRAASEALPAVLALLV
jgi:NTE family protein